MKTNDDLVAGWLAKADSDRRTLLATKRDRIFDAVCFHAQQWAEKTVKAFLIHHQIEFPFTHVIDKLVDLCIPLDPQFEQVRADGRKLTPYAVELRYDPSQWPSEAEAEETEQAARRGVQFVLARLPEKVRS